MAEILSPLGGTMFKTKVVKEGRTYEVSTVNTSDHGWETLIFSVPGGYVRTGFEAAHTDYESAKEGHERAVQEFTRA